MKKRATEYRTEFVALPLKPEETEENRQRDANEALLDIVRALARMRAWRDLADGVSFEEDNEGLGV